MSDCSEKLEEAKLALHKLRIGRSRVRVRFSGNNGERDTTYNKADIPALTAYVEELEAECGGTTDSEGVVTKTPRRKAIHFYG